MTAQPLPHPAWIWRDGDLIAVDAGAVSPYTHGLHYATGCFEGIRSYTHADGRPRVFRLDEHIQRLFDSAARMNVRIDHSQAEIAEACIAVAARNGLAEAYIRPLAFLVEPFHVWARTTGRASVVVMAVPLATPFDDDAIVTKRAIVSRYVRATANRDFHRAKAIGHYSLVSIVAHEARAAGCDQALFVDEHRHVCEALTDNVFAVIDGTVCTPPASAPILLGITRRTALELLTAAGAKTAERAIPLDELVRADEVFTTSTAGGIQAITHIDDRAVGDGRIGPTTRQLYHLHGRTIRGMS